MNLQRYIDRIGYSGAIDADFATLAAMHEAHVCSVPFENLDVQLGRTLSIGVEEAFEKIVGRNRGGWCYEQNGLFGWALSEIGFEVTRIAASVMRQQHGAASAASHLCLLVRASDADTLYLVDVGFGGSMIRPIALRTAQVDQAPFKIGVEKLDDGYWRFWEDMGDGRFTYDFREEPASEVLLAAKSDFLQSDPSSGFVLNLVAQRRSRSEHRILRGRIFTVARQGATATKTLDSPDALVSVLATEFGLNVDGVAGLWSKVSARHEELFGKSRR